MPKIILIRGLPGSGKSTMAKNMKGFTHVEADMFFLDDDGNYCPNIHMAPAAHRWCQNVAFSSLERGNNVVVSNTFITLKEMQPYFDMGYPVEVIEATGNYGSIHNIPQHIIERMHENFEPYKG